MGWWSDIWDKIGKYAYGTAFIVGGGGVMYLAGVLPKDSKPIGQAAGGGLVAYGLYKIYKVSQEKEEDVKITNFKITVPYTP